MRKRKAKKRPLLPDPKFNDQLVTRFVNMLMWDGKKSIAFKIFYDALDIIESKKQEERLKKALLEVFPVNLYRQIKELPEVYDEDHKVIDHFINHGINEMDFKEIIKENIYSFLLIFSFSCLLFISIDVFAGGR